MTATADRRRPTGPLPPRDEQPADVAERFAAYHAAIARGIARLMVHGTPAAAAALKVSREKWASTSAGDATATAETFAWIAELGRTPDTAEAIVNLFRLADLIEWQRI